jgi:Acyltransferase C-terminus
MWCSSVQTSHDLIVSPFFICSDSQAYSGYDGSLPPAIDLSMTTLWDLLRRKFPKEVHLRIKRYSMEEVLQDSNWLFKKWAEKDRLLSHFARYHQFPTDNRQHRVFETRSFSLETSIVALIRLLVVPCAVPFLLLLSVPLFWTLSAIWLGQRAFRLIFRDQEPTNSDDSRPGSVGGAGQRTPGSASAAGTPFFPATPFASPSILNWRDMFSPNDNNGTR